ncbi:MAG: metallophosphoesterase [Actinomycetota bacterium]|nr:metallophosphoesterase [Actinomycetota bacterium]
MRAKRMLRYLVVLTLGGLGALLLLRFVPLPDQQLGPAQVRTTATMGGGNTAVVIPPLGRITAQTHDAPISFGLELVELDLSSIGTAVASDEGRDELADLIERDLGGVLRRAGVLLVMAGAAGGALVGALMPYRKWKYIVTAAAGGFLAVSTLFGMSLLTFDPDGWEEPQFTGTLERAPDMLEVVNRNLGSIDNLRDRFQIASRRISDLVALLAQPLDDPEGGTVSILHVSDIHSNPLGIEITRQLATQFDVAAVIDTGDLTSFGSPIEARVGELIEGFPVPYLFIPGNHDSTANRVQLSRIEGVTLLDRETSTVGGLDVLGWADPTFTASNEITTEEGNEVRDQEASEVEASVSDLQPDILAVHDQRLATESYGDVPLVLSGHTHDRDLRIEDGSVQLVVGSTGATGLGAFTIKADLPYEAELVYLRDGLPSAVDYVSFRSLGGEFEIQRELLDGSFFEGASP